MGKFAKAVKGKCLTTTNMKLTIKQENFCRYYVEIGGNASEAYRMAYDASNMLPQTIWSAACRLLADSKVNARIEEIKREMVEDSKIERHKVEKVLMEIVQADPMDLYILDPKTGKMKLRTPSQLTKRARMALKKIQNKRGEVTYEYHGKTEAARLLGAWNGWDAPKQVDIKSGSNPIGELRIGFDDEEESEK